LANLTAAGLMRGTAVYTFDDIFAQLEGVGASLSFSGAYHTTGFSAMPGRGPGVGAGHRRRRVARADFPEAELNQVRGQIITGLQMRADDPQRMASLAFHELIYPHHPYGRSSSGSLDTVPTLTGSGAAGSTSGITARRR
jgi:zinc protease